jgi:NitT/TauT family transport system permease protein
VRTVEHALGGFALAALLGIAAGLGAGLNPLWRRAMWPIVSLLQGMPVIAWIVLSLLWFGTGDSPPVLAVGLSCLPIVFVGAIQGVATVDRNLLQMARSFRAPLSLLLRDLYLPHLLSYLFPALLSGLGIAWKVALTAELLAADKGIGADFGMARVNLNMAEAMAWVLVMLALMFAFEYLVVHPLQRWLEPWRREKPEMAAGSLPAQASA